MFSRCRGSALHDVMLAIEKVRRVDRVRWHGAESREAVERRRRPLPSVADEIVNAPRARARRIRADRNRIPVREIEVTARRVWQFLAPRIAALFARRRAERRAVI